MEQKIIAIDFDGTLVDNQFPDIGSPRPGAIETVRSLIRNGHNIFLYTVRGTVDTIPGRNLLQEAIDYIEQALGPDAIGYNKSPIVYSNSPKLFADIYIDDSSLGCPKQNGKTDWFRIARLLYMDGLITETQFNSIKQTWD